jgi:hypothetical protein
MMLRAVSLTGVELKMDESNNGIHPTRISMDVIMNSAVAQLPPGG